MFTGCVPSEIILTQAIEALEIKTIIIQAHQEFIHDIQVNVLLMEIMGEPDNISEAVKYFKTNNLHVEILGYVHNNH